jgi:M6 family metalloprotease-like protein
MWPPTLADLGHGSMTQLGRAAAGGRPLLIILGEYSNFPAFSTKHPMSYYEALGFGNPNLPFSTDNPVNPASLTEYFREVSSGRFWFNEIRIYGPVALGTYSGATDPGPEVRTAGILSRVAAAAPQLFVAQDANSDRTIAFDELCVVLFENIDNLQPANRDNNPVTFSVHLPGLPISIDETIRVHIAGAGPVTPFYQIAHELSHSLGTVDMYNTGQGNIMLTLMSRYSFTANDQVPVHLDMWHKLQLGWAEPRIFRLSDPGSTAVQEGAAGAIVLWDNSRGANEYFLVERRRHNAPGQRFDIGVAGDGILIWRVQKGMVNGVAHMGAPNLVPGGSGVWQAGQQTPMLTWADSSPTNCYLTMGALADGSINVNWGDQLSHPSSRHLDLFYGGNGTTPVDSGLPMVGIFYGVRTDGNLEWNRYNGSGQVVGDPQSVQEWNSNSGNLIGRGWQGMKKLLGCGDGVIMAVDPEGFLRWYCYQGNGESDVTGSRGWHPNSGNRIGRGWNFKDMFVFPAEGHNFITQLFAVDFNGDLRWYGYTGDGTADPTGGTGWLPNSGNKIGRGWQNFLHLHGSGNTVFAVAGDGRLLWYSYTGGGVSDPTGGTGWNVNSGNPIGNGWQGLTRLFGGVTDDGTFGHVLMGVNGNNDLLWYKYTGNGEGDVSGHLGWVGRSGNRVGTNW